MPRKIFIILVILAASLAIASDPNLPQSLSRGRELLDEAVSDSTPLAQVATELADGAAAFPASSIAPEALHVAMMLSQRCGNIPVAQACANRIIFEYPRSPFAENAFQTAWDYLTTNGQYPGTGAEVAKHFALALQNDTRATRYFTLAFHGFAADGRWKDAAEMGEKFMAAAGSEGTDPTAYILMSDIALRLGNTGLAKQSLETFTQRYSTLPQMVIAHNRLGHLQTALGHGELARDHFTASWSLYQKKSSQSEFAGHEIAHAAAEALWTLQTPRREAFDGLTQSSATFSEPAAKKSAESLIEGYERVALTDPHFALQSYSAMGDVYAKLSTALATSALNSLRLKRDNLPRENPLSGALHEATRSIAYYRSAYDRAIEPGHDDIDRARDKRSAAQYVAGQVFEMLSAQGDWLNSFAERLIAVAPNELPGNDTELSRLNFFAEHVLPVAMSAYKFKYQALTLPDEWPLGNLKSMLAHEADLPLQQIVLQMTDVCADECRRTSTAAIQLASTVKFGLQTSSSSGLVKSFQISWNRAEKSAGLATDALITIYSSVQASHPAPGNLAAWNEMIVSTITEFTNSANTAHESLAAAAEILPMNPDEAAAFLRADLNRLAADCGSAEFKSLAQWHDFAANRGLLAEGPNLAARLAQLDPGRYGTGIDPSASRASP